MCYLRDYGAETSLKEFVDLFWQRAGRSEAEISKALEIAFGDPQTASEADITR